MAFLRCSTLMLAHLHCKARKQRAKLCSCILQRVWKGVSKILRSQTSVVAHSQEFLCLYAPDANLHTTIFYSQLGLRYLKQPHKLVCVLVALVLSQSSIVCQIVAHALAPLETLPGRKMSRRRRRTEKKGLFRILRSTRARREFCCLQSRRERRRLYCFIIQTTRN